jgi:hypothetical protein
MRLSDLLRSEVFDADGERIGHVHDVRFVRDGPDQGAFGPAYRLQGLIVGTGSLGSRLGFDRADVRGPLPLKAFFRWLHANTKFIEWPLVEKVNDNKITVRARKDDLPTVPPLKG